jgi:urease alpha subunit
MKWEVNELFQLKKRLMGVYNIAGINEKDMKFNDLVRAVEIDRGVYPVRVDGQVINSAPADFAVVERSFHVLIATQ